MNTYKYEALADDGSPVEGVIEAYSSDEAMAKVKAEYDIITSLEETGRNVDINLALIGKRTKDKTLALICSQFSIILSSGLPIVRTVELVAGQTKDKTMKQTLLDVADDVAAGYSLADSFETHGKGLPNTFIETIRAGESSGNLQQCFERLGEYFDKKAKASAKVGSAMIYPAFVVIIAIIVVIIIMTYAVPVFSTAFASLDVELPWITRSMIASSAWFQKYILVLIIAIAAIVVILKVYSKSDPGRHFFSKLGLKLPLFGRINKMNGSAQYASTMSIMLAAGLSVMNSVDITSRAMTNAVLSDALSGTLVDLESGKRLGDCLEKSGKFPELITEMTKVGEETGSLEDTLHVISDYYDHEAAVASERAMSVLEPTIIIILAVFVVGILLSVYLPLFSMYGAM